MAGDKDIAIVCKGLGDGLQISRQQSCDPDSAAGDHWDSVASNLLQGVDGDGDTHTHFQPAAGSNLVYRGVKTFFWTHVQVAVAIHILSTAAGDEGRGTLLSVRALVIAEATGRAGPGPTTPFVLSHIVQESRAELLADKAKLTAAVSAVLSLLQLTHGHRPGIHGVSLQPTHAASLDAFQDRRDRRDRLENDGQSRDEAASPLETLVRVRSSSFGTAAGHAQRLHGDADPGVIASSLQSLEAPAGHGTSPWLGKKAGVVHPKVVDAETAVGYITAGQTVTISGFVGSGHPEELVLALANRFRRTGAPGGMTLVFGVAQGDTAGRGLDVLAQEGCIGRIISAHNGVAPSIQRYIMDEKCEGFNVPLGCLSQLLRDIAAGKPGMVTTVGLGTVVDPRHGGCAMNQRARASQQPVVSLETLGGVECLWFKAFPIHVALLRGTTADPRGNISMEEEVGPLDVLHQAMAAHCKGGLVIVQVRRLVDHLLPGNVVRVPGILVDHVVVADPAHHWQTFASPILDPSLCGQERTRLEKLPVLPLDAVKVAHHDNEPRQFCRCRCMISSTCTVLLCRQLLSLASSCPWQLPG